MLLNNSGKHSKTEQAVIRMTCFSRRPLQLKKSCEEKKKKEEEEEERQTMPAFKNERGN